jgi:hypothetical protein
LEHTLRFALHRYDTSDSIEGGASIYRLLADGDQRPVEKELQREFYLWLANSPEFAGRVNVEVSDVSHGRVDVIVRINEITIVTEVKRELQDASRPSIDRFVPQAAQYSGSNVAFSQLLVLDLSDHSAGVPPLGDLIWTVEHRARPDASPQHVVACVVVGNRPTPSQLSSYEFVKKRGNALS